MDRSVTLRTERLTLRKLTEADIPALVAGLNDYAVAEWLSVVPYPYGEADARAFLAYLEAGPALDGIGIHAAQRLVGVVGIGADHLGYWLARSAWGRGYATEASGALCWHFFETTDEDRLISGYFAGNVRSGKVLTKLGFRPDGTEIVEARARGEKVELQRMQLTRADWEARHG